MLIDILLQFQIIDCLIEMFSHMCTIEYNRIDNDDIEYKNTFVN